MLLLVAYIEKIDGKPIVKGQDYFPATGRQSRKKVLLAIYNPATGKRFRYHHQSYQHRANKVNLLV